MEEKDYAYGDFNGSLIIGEVRRECLSISTGASLYNFNVLRNVNILNKGEKVNITFRDIHSSETKNGVLQIVYGKPRVIDSNGGYHKLDTVHSIHRY